MYNLSWEIYGLLATENIYSNNLYFLSFKPDAIPKVTSKKDDMHTTVGVLGPKHRRAPLEKFMIVCITVISTLLGFAILTAKKCKSKGIKYHEKLELMPIQSNNDDGKLLSGSGHIRRLSKIQSGFSARGLCSGKPNPRTHTRLLSRYLIRYHSPQVCSASFSRWQTNNFMRLNSAGTINSLRPNCPFVQSVNTFLKVYL